LTTKFGVSNLSTLRKSVFLLGSCDVTQRQGQPAVLNAGAEFGYARESGESVIGIDGLALRAGVDGYAIEDRYGYRDYINNSLNYTLGLGTNVTFIGYRLQLDYVYGMYRLGVKNRFSIGLYF
jgi:hypothetical protein